LKRTDLEVAKHSLDRCRDLASKMGEASTPKQMDSLWSDFLIGSQRVFSKVAAASSGKSAAWFGKIKKERSEDELLAYVHQARHADEHGLEKVAHAVGGKLAVKHDGSGKPLILKQLIIGKEGELENVEAENAVVDFKAADAALIPVKNRGQVYAPPTRHLDQPWTDNTAQAVAKATLAYMDKMISEGEQYVVD
jgi:hypothetical protein